MLINCEEWQVYLNLQGRGTEKLGGTKHSSSFLKATTTTLLHTIDESEKACYVAHINSFLGDDPFLKQYLPLDPSTNDLFNLAKDGVLLWYLRRCLLDHALLCYVDEYVVAYKQYTSCGLMQ